MLTPEIAERFGFIGRGSFQGIPVRFFILLVFSIPLWFFHAYTETGRGMEAIAGNAGAARLYGIKVDWVRMLSFIFSGVCSAMGGLVMTSSIMSARPTDNLHYILGALAACFIGASTLRIGLFHIGGTLLGVFLTVVATNGLIILMVPSYVTKVVTGTILLLAILLSIVASRFIRR
jgi:ribose transport system permease protein